MNLSSKCAEIIYMFFPSSFLLLFFSLSFYFSHKDYINNYIGWLGNVCTGGVAVGVAGIGVVGTGTGVAGIG